jgi:NADPH-dependent FMN reductase
MRLLPPPTTPNSLNAACNSKSPTGQSTTRVRTKANSRLPVYNEDLERDVPKDVLDFKKTIAAADGFVIVTPEYNYSYPPLTCGCVLMRVSLGH